MSCLLFFVVFCVVSWSEDILIIIDDKVYPCFSAAGAERDMRFGARVHFTCPVKGLGPNLHVFVLWLTLELSTICRSYIRLFVKQHNNLC